MIIKQLLWYKKMILNYVQSQQCCSYYAQPGVCNAYDILFRMRIWQSKINISTIVTQKNIINWILILIEQSANDYLRQSEVLSSNNNTKGDLGRFIAPLFGIVFSVNHNFITKKIILFLLPFYFTQQTTIIPIGRPRHIRVCDYGGSVVASKKSS